MAGILSGWYRAVESTRGRPGTFAAYGTVLLGICFYGGGLVLNSTNPNYALEGAASKSSELEKLPMDQKVLAKANKQRLVDLLKDIQQGKDAGRYEAALKGHVVAENPVAHERVTYGSKQQ